MAQTLGESKAYERALIQIQPQTLKFFQDRVVADHIMLTLLAFEHRDLQVLHLSPTGG